MHPAKNSRYIVIFASPDDITSSVAEARGKLLMPKAMMLLFPD
jgi:hypothetical protein